MALHWNIGDIENWEEVCQYVDNPEAPEDEQVTKLKPFTNALIWATMGIGMREITEKNYKEFYSRLRYSDALDGNKTLAWDFEKREQRDYTLEDVKRHIGLSTNASNLTRNQFIKREAEHWERMNGKL